MRPVDKGPSPDKIYHEYKDAKPELIRRLGAFCSYCEFPISHAPEIDHVEAKARGGAMVEWGNLLLACKYCNSRKRDIVGKGDKEKYIWPDEDDTFHVFSYAQGIPSLNDEYLKQKEPGLREKAKNLYDLLELGNNPDSLKNRDERFFRRDEAYNIAVESLADFEKMQTAQDKENYLRQTIRLAISEGFFSVWMEVFKNHPEVRRELIKAFPGTKKQYFDEDGFAGK